LPSGDKQAAAAIVRAGLGRGFQLPEREEIKMLSIDKENHVLSDFSGMSGSDRKTLKTLFSHPLPHNLKWKDAVSLFDTLGSVEEKSKNEFSFRIGGEHLIMSKPSSKDLTSSELMDLRHFAARAGWSANAYQRPGSQPDPSASSLLVVIDHHEARIYEIDVVSSDVSKHLIQPYDPHHFLHHLTHKDQSRDHGQRAPEDFTYYERIAQAITLGGRIILMSHGNGKSSAGRHLAKHLSAHHSETYRRIVHEVDADFVHMTEPQLLEIARNALI